MPASALGQQLGLEFGGGVYFEGSRVDPISGKAFLFVGLGGTGADALLRIKNQVYTRMNLPKDNNGMIIADAPDTVGFLEVDSAEDTQAKAYGQVRFDPQGADFQSIGVNNLAGVIAHVLLHEMRNNPEMAWYDEGVNAIAGLDGACGIRQIGRLLLFKNINAVRQKVQSIVNRIAGHANSLHIFVVSGIGGGTGSGTFLDMAYLLRHIAENDCHINNVQLMGYIVTPDLNLQNGGTEEAMYCNGFASLKELDYWMASDEHQTPFVQNYGGGCIVNMLARPFDYCHIISGQSFTNNHRVSYDEALSAISENLFAYISNDMGIAAQGNTTFESMYVNIANQVNGCPKPFPASYRYLSIGADMRRIPYAEIAALLGARVFQKLKAPFIDRAPTQDEFKAEQKALGLTDEAFRGFALQNTGANPLNGKISGRNRYRWEDIWNRTTGNVPAKRVHDWLAASQPAIARQCANLAPHREGQWKQRFAVQCGDIKLGPCYIARLLYSNKNYNLITTMERARVHYAELAQQCAERSTTLKQEVEGSYTDGSSAGFGRRGDAAQSYLEKLNLYAENELLWFMYRDLDTALGKLVERLKIYYDKLFSPLKDTLEELCQIFENNYTRLAAAENQAADAPDPKQLIMPFAFEQAHQGILAQQVNAAAAGFAAEIRNKMQLWVGLDITTVDDDTPHRTDISGEVSRYIESQFSAQMNTSIEVLLNARMTPGQTPNDMYDQLFADLRNGSVPMFSPSAVYNQAAASEFAFLCIPGTCPNILLRAQTILPHNPAYGQVNVKQSQETDKIYWAKIITGLPLYAFARLQQMETHYENRMRTRETRAGVHLYYDWYETLPSPIPESTWGAGYFCEHTARHNREFRACYDTCLKEGILACRNTPMGMVMQLRTAPQPPALSALRGNLNQSLAAIDQIRDLCWGSGGVEELHALGQLYMQDGTVEEQLTRNARENVLRFNNKCQLLKEQAEYLKSIQDARLELEVIQYYVYARAAELFYVDHLTKIMLRRSPVDYAPVEVYDRNHPKPHEDYHMYRRLLAIFDDDWRKNLEQQWSRVCQECQNNPAKKDKLFARLDARIALCRKELDAVEEEISRVPVDLQAELHQIRQYFQYCVDACESCKAIFGYTGNDESEDLSLV